MPNHCSQVMTIKGTEEGIARFKRNVIKPIPEEEKTGWSGDEYFDFNAIIEMPKCLEDTTAPIKDWMWARDRHQRNAFDVWAMTRNNEVLAVQLPIILV